MVTVESSKVHNSLSDRFRSVYKPLLTSITLVVLSALSGSLPITLLLVTNFSLSLRGFNLHMHSLVLAVEVLAPLFSFALIRSLGRKILLLVSAAIMTATLIFLALLAYWDDEHGRATAHLSLAPTVQATSSMAGAVASVVYLIAYHFGTRPFTWLAAVELVPCRALGLGVGWLASAHWAFNLVFSVGVLQLTAAVGVSGLCWMFALVSALSYGFILECVPDIRMASLEDIEKYYANCVKAFSPHATLKEQRKVMSEDSSEC